LFGAEQSPAGIGGNSDGEALVAAYGGIWRYGGGLFQSDLTACPFSGEQEQLGMLCREEMQKAWFGHCEVAEPKAEQSA
jgi:hypothetical protein